jgi:hypothetical protein
MGLVAAVFMIVVIAVGASRKVSQAMQGWQDAVVVFNTVHEFRPAHELREGSVAWLPNEAELIPAARLIFLPPSKDRARELPQGP